MQSTTIIDNCSFININVKYGDSALTWHGAGLSLNNCYFANNNANNGRLVIFYGENINVTNCTFINNTCSKIIDFTSFADCNQLNNCKFINNNPSEGSVVNFAGNECIMTNCSFVNNTASKSSTVYWSGAQGLIFNCSYVDNSAYIGGAIYITGDECILKDSIFYDNYALNGGAIYWLGSEGILTNCILYNNTASSANDGGAIYWKGKLGNISNCLFINNSAYGGSAISIYGDNTLVDNCSLIENYGYGAAGAIYINAMNCILNNSYFENNFATQLAGAILISKNNTILENCTFANNSANDGGAIIIQEDNNHLINCIFRDNNASSLAGAIFIMKNDCILENCTFVNNSANEGGAILIQGNTTVLKQNSFINNNASGFGGAIYWMSPNGILTNSSFNNNYAKNGGAIFWQGDNGALTDCVFIDNYAPNNGSSIYWYGTYGNLTNSIVIDNIKSNQIYWWNTENGNIENCKFINNTNGVINKGAKFSRINISLSYSNPSFDFKDPKNISVTLMGVSDELLINSSIIFNFNNNEIVKEFIVNLSENFASVYNELTDLDAGNWIVNAIFAGDDNYAPCNTTFSIIVNPLSSSLNMGVNDTDVYKETVLIVNVKDKFNSIINEGYVTFFDGETNIGESNVTNGVATLTYVPETAGKHLILVKYYAKNYINNTNSVDLNVEKVDSNIIISDMFFNYSGRGSANFNLDGAIEINASIINNSNAIVDIIDYNVFVSGLDAGNYVLEITTIPDANHVSIIKHVNITVNPINADLTVNAPNIETGSNGIVNIEINKGITGKVLVYNDEIVIVDGKGTYTINNPTIGNHTVSVIFEGDNNFLADTKIVSFEVTKKSVPADQNPFTPAKTDDGNQPNNPSYTITLNEDATGNLTVTIGEKTFIKELINGTATVEVSGVPAGEYVATIAYTGDDNYAPITRTVNATVKVDPLITASNVNVVYSAGSYYTIKVYGTDSKLADGAKVVITVKGKTFKTLTTANGVAKFKVTNVPGTYKMTITALGKSVTKTLTVKHLVTLKSVTVKKSAKKLTLQATLGKVNGKYLKNKKITFKFNGKKYTAKTDKKGVAKVTIKKSVLKKLKVGKKVKYQANYGNAIAKKTTKIKK